MEQQEIWKPIKGYEKFYEISNFGKVRTFERIVQQKKRTIKYKARELSLNKSGKKYYYVDLVDDMGKRKRFYVHRLVAMMLKLPNPLLNPLPYPPKPIGMENGMLVPLLLPFSGN